MSQRTTWNGFRRLNVEPCATIEISENFGISCKFVKFSAHAFYRLAASHLVQFICLRLVLGGKIQEKLLDVPVEKTGQVGLQIEGYKAKVVKFLTGAIIGHVLHQRLHSVDLNVGTIIEENGADEAAESQTGQHTKCVGENGISAGQNCVHDARRAAFDER